MRLTVTRLDPSIPVPVYASERAAGFDLSAARDMEVAPRGLVLVPTGLVVQVPDGHFLAIIARSSTPLKRGLMVANSVGVIDPDYCGPQDEVKIQLYNFTDAPVHIRKGDRLAQGLVLPAPRVEFVEGHIEAPSRGGFGSTGT